MRLPACCFCLITALTPVLAQTLATEDPHVTALKARFQEGIALEKENKLTEARAIFDGILTEDPKARGSLFYAGLVSVRLEDFSRAVSYLIRYREIDPKDHRAIVLLIQSYQALRLDDRVESLRGELHTLRQGPSVAGLTDAQSYVREKIHNPDDSVTLFLEYFDENQAPRRIWEMQTVTPGNKPPRQFALLTAPSGTSGSYRLVEYDLSPTPVAPYRILRLSQTRPDYATCRGWMLEAAKN